MKNVFGLMKSMFRIGCIGFGGGSALIPILEQELVSEEKQGVSKQNFDECVVVASITPGALPVEIASGAGYRLLGNRGMLVAPVGLAFPGAFLTVLLLILFSYLDVHILQQVNFLAVGVSVVIIYLLTDYMKSVVNQGTSRNRKRNMILLIWVVFLLNGGKEIFALLQIDRSPVFDISSIQIMALAFFLILYLGKKRTTGKTVVAVLCSIVYLLCVGKGNVIRQEWIETTVKGCMVVLGAYGLVISLKEQRELRNMDISKIWNCIGVWSAFLFILVLPACLICEKTMSYLGRGLLSSVMSFGGGDAYLSVAEGLFVNAGLVSEEIFYNQIMTIVNLLPGSILCKTLSGTGYVIGYTASGMVWKGILMAIAGFGVSVFGSCGVFMICLHVYNHLQELELFRLVGKYIRSIISGLLVNICLSLLKCDLNIASHVGISVWAMMLFLVCLYLLVRYMKKKKGSYGKTIIISIVLAMTFCNVGCVL